MKLFDRVLLVGNGPSATRGDLGSIIDRFETIVRFNNFTLEGMESQVGARTTIWARNDTQTVLSRSERFLREIRLDRRATEIDETGSVVCLPYMRIDESTWLSTGLVVADYFISRGKPLCLHGFDFFKGDRHHYFPSQSRNTKHSGALEEERVRAWVRSGSVRFLEKAVLAL